MKKLPLITLAFFGSILTASAQTVDTVKLNAEINTLQITAGIIQERQDISIKGGIAALNAIQIIIQNDNAILERERKKKKP